jgi:hypothetical protein
MHWEEYGEGLRAKTEHGTYTIGPTRCGWWVSFHCACCRQFTQVVPMDSQLDRCKAKAVEHQESLLKRYAEAQARY